MGKALLASTTALLLLLISAASTTGQLSSRCERQARTEKIEHCHQYLRSEMRVLMFPNDDDNQACCLRECCDMLQDMDEGCVCEVVESLVEEMRERTRMVGRERGLGRVLLRKAMAIPERCGVSARGCDVRDTMAL